MTARTFTRSAFLATLVGAGMLAAAPAAHAARNADAEQYVQTNAQAALNSLSNTSVSRTQRQQTFNTLMARFADMPRIANFVLGRYGAQLRTDAALRAEWTRAFQDYSIAVYEAQLEQYSTSTLRVVNSVERVAGRDVIVVSEMTPRGSSRALRVQWRMLRSGETWKVVDVSLVDNGTEIWLAQQQQRDFLAALDRNNGNIRALMTTVQGQTASMRQRVMARS
ncbi:ABC-type transport system [alpha proteobacterium U9-1i]|nr:ABC-type transport system [alpha proteobacterium U9-1i]